MQWSRRYAIKSYLKSALWTAPLIALVLEQITIRIVSAIGPSLAWIPQVETTVAGTTGVMDTVVSLTMSFIVFTFGSMLVAIQVASGQLTPRIIATTLLRDNVIRITVGLFVFTMLFAIGTRARIDVPIPRLAVAITVFLGIVSVTAFLFLIDYTAKLMRPVTIVWRIGEQGIKVIKAVYPEAAEAARMSRRRRPAIGPAGRVLAHRGTSAIVLALNLQSLLALAQAAGGVIEFIPRVGDFVAIDEPLFRLYGGAVAIDDHTLRAQVAFGRERTIEQDSTFAFRVIVDVAIKALSQAINDPTTAVLAIDQLHRMLRLVGKCHLHDDALYDVAGELRLIAPTPDWEDFVQLTFSEIRLYGAGNFQVARRLRAMIENLTANLPEARLPALRRELGLLDRTLETLHRLPEDLALSRKADLQGLGGSSAS
jgi:uncharacterized membrane protein